MHEVKISLRASDTRSQAHVEESFAHVRELKEDVKMVSRHDTGWRTATDYRTVPQMSLLASGDGAVGRKQAVERPNPA